MSQWVYLLDLVDDPEVFEQYDSWHRSVWPEVLAHLVSSGIQTCTIHRAGNRLVMLVESDSPTPTDGGGSELPGRVQEWEHLMDRFQQRLPFAEARQKWVLANRIFEWVASPNAGHDG